MDIAFNDDIVIENGDLKLVQNSDAVAQYLRARLFTFLGEWFLDKSIGIPYFEEIFKKNINTVVVDSILKEKILTCPGIIELLEFNWDITSERRLFLKFKVRSKEGLIEFSEII